jgi:hypothetical protein
MRKNPWLKICEFGDDLRIFSAADAGDYGPLIELLRSGANLKTGHRELLIAILEGKIKRPSHRQPSLRTLERKRAITKRVRELKRQDWKPHAAVIQVAAEFRCKDRTVWNALRHGRVEERVREMLLRDKEKRQAADEIAREVGLSDYLTREVRLRLEKK